MHDLEAMQILRKPYEFVAKRRDFLLTEVWNLLSTQVAEVPSGIDESSSLGALEERSTRAEGYQGADGGQRQICFDD